jgi:hypothetical protein
MSLTAEQSNKSNPALDSSRTSLASRLILLQEMDRELSALKLRKDRTKLSRYKPYSKQLAFHSAGATHRERLLMAGNQLGKTFCGAAEAAIHLTGNYPDWWPGRRWERPVRAWAVSVGQIKTARCSRCAR